MINLASIGNDLKELEKYRAIGTLDDITNLMVDNLRLQKELNVYKEKGSIESLDMLLNNVDIVTKILSYIYDKDVLTQDMKQHIKSLWEK